MFDNHWDLANIMVRGFLLAGLVSHKLIWTILRPGSASAGALSLARPPAKLTAIKTVKTAILIGLLLQAIAPTVLPIWRNASLAQSTGLLLYAAGWLVAVTGRIQLGANWQNIEEATVIKRQAVVSHGLYRYIRHPIYTGDLLLIIGFELTLNSWFLVGAIVLTPIVLRQALREETMLVQRLPGYDDYRRRTRRFIPFLV